MSDSKRAIEALHKFIDAFNRVDKDGMCSMLHFPHAVHSDGNDPTVYSNGDEFWDHLAPQFSKMKEAEGWAYSTLDLTEQKSTTCLLQSQLFGYLRRTDLAIPL